MKQGTICKTMFLVLIMMSMSSFAQEGSIGDGLIEGPGLFSGEAGAFELLKRSSSEPSGDMGGSDGGSVASSDYAISDMSEDEFALFKNWLKAKQQNSAEYQEFKVWVTYLEYKRQAVEKSFR